MPTTKQQRDPDSTILLLCGAVIFLCSLVAVVKGQTFTERTHEEWHLHADRVLYPRLAAAVNEYTEQHPRDSNHTPGDHVRKHDKGDVERLKAVDAAYREWRDALKEAGYKK
jgi:hypothetical protein